MIPVPFVSVRNCDRKPISPRAGIRKSSRTRPLPWLTIFVIVPRRCPTCAMTIPWKSSATSITSSSTGSTTWPPSSLVTISGRDTWSSKPSRRIISMRIESCSSPRPRTFICSGESVSSTRIDTLPSSSRSSRSRRLRDVTYCPSRPATGDVFTPKTIETVGSSTAIGGIATGCSASAIVSPIVMFSIPARQTMSPAAASSMSTRLSPSNAYSFVTFVRSTLPSTRQTAIGSPIFTRPLTTRPIAIRPR